MTPLRRLPLVPWLGALLALLVLAAAPAVAQAPTGTRLHVFEQAQFLPGKPGVPPPDTAPWKPVSLPDNWHVSRPGFRGAGWYRIELPEVLGDRVYGVYLPRNAAPVTLVYLNGRILGTTGRPDPHVRLNQQPYMGAAPPASFGPGTNVLHFFVAADADLHQGLTRVWFGPSLMLREIWLAKFNAHVLLVVAFAFAVITTGLIALAIWARSQREPVFFWTGISAVLLGAPTVFNFYAGPGETGVVKDLLQLFFTHAYAPALALGVLHLTGRVSKPMPWVLWGILLAGCLLSLLPAPVSIARINIALSTLYLAILGAVAVKLIAARAHPAPWLRAAVAAAIIAAIAVGLHDLAIWFGWLDFDRLSLSPHAAPLLTLAVGALVISRHLEAARGLALSNATLEQRVAERGAQIERVQMQLREAESERARATERQRILSDIHDGLGSSLVSLLSVSQSGNITPREVERRVHDALVELRVAVDAQDIVDGDLITALASVRYRMRDALQAAGITLDWRVGDMPPLDHLSGSAILDIQRMMLEALANVIRHAGATQIAVVTRHDDQEVCISIADNGCGFDLTAARPAGRGLMTMQRRAAAVGGTCTIESTPGQGTRVMFTLKRG